MKQLYKPIGLILFGIILGAALFKGCSKPKVTEHTTVTVKDSIVRGKDSTITITHFVPKWKHDTVLEKVDSAAIRNNAVATFYAFNAKNIYDSTLINDKLGLFRVKFNTQFNKVWNFEAQIRRDTLYKIKTVTTVSTAKTRNKLIVGAVIGSNLTETDIYGSAWLVTKSGSLFQVGYDPFKKQVIVGAGVTIRLRK